jgi:hypothetical protein
LTPEGAEAIAKSIPAILIITGDSDNVIDPVQSKILHDMLPVR